MNDAKLDKIINDIIYIFNLEGVELVRLSGLVKRFNEITRINPETIHTYIIKLKRSKLINFNKITICPHCKEISYRIKDISNEHKILCDSCQNNYDIINELTIYDDISKIELIGKIYNFGINLK